MPAEIVLGYALFQKWSGPQRTSEGVTPENDPYLSI